MAEDLVPSVCSWVVWSSEDVRSQGGVSLKGSLADLRLPDLPICASRTAHSCPREVACTGALLFAGFSLGKLVTW